ncbi:hypothetical protein ARD30_08955 [Bosea thiooxidans]|uniref:Nicotinamide-nucleotide amidase n=1 Tax=Bosea thiooxidans TaxID=53254 RepID=A0A0Q3T2E4_9HYPH|nr:nicotinamide-nucleotide amidohydrolase family protein [Bosea thiooxidans]KQK31858.1 hypothetical protein ARD30_08955 [Bosea thiooxidans]SKC13178.1 nicotinamide-nucleotide amidase [Bosea thiooxidans]
MSEIIGTRICDTHALPDIDALAERLIATALRLQIRIVTVESCTAGLMAHALSQPFGAASALAGGFITYTKDAKEKLVDVPRNLLEEYTAVHAEVARAMAVGALKRSQADCALAVTGVTGSEPDEDGNPIGRAFIGTARGSRTAALHCEFGELAPDALTHATMQAALCFMLAQLGDEGARRSLQAAQADERQTRRPGEGSGSLAAGRTMASPRW